MTGTVATGTPVHSEGTDITREWLLAAGSVMFTVVTAVALLRWLAPQLLGVPADLQLVKASETVPPFFENIFRAQDFAGDGLLLHDPYTNTRFRPLLRADGNSGPHDLLGFRNSGIPNHPVVIVIPTRELVYAGKVAQAQLDTPETYRQLVRMEQENIESLAASIRNVRGARYVDMVRPLQAAALTDAALYPRQWDGHPGREGYAVIARTLAQAVARSVSPSPGQ